MMLKKTTLLLIFSFFIGTFSYAQHIAVSNNLLFDLAGAFSAGVEIPLSNRTSVEAYGSIRPWKRSDDNVHKHWLVQAQFRIWPCQVMNGFFMLFFNLAILVIAIVGIVYSIIQLDASNGNIGGWMLGSSILLLFINIIMCRPMPKSPSK